MKTTKDSIKNKLDRLVDKSYFLPLLWALNGLSVLCCVCTILLPNNLRLLKYVLFVVQCLILLAILTVTVHLARRYFPKHDKGGKDTKSEGSKKEEENKEVEFTVEEIKHNPLTRTAVSLMNAFIPGEEPLSERERTLFWIMLHAFVDYAQSRVRENDRKEFSNKFVGFVRATSEDFFPGAVNIIEKEESEEE